MSIGANSTAKRSTHPTSRVAYISLHCSSFLGLPFRILNMKLVKPKKGTTMETIGVVQYEISMAARGGVSNLVV